MFSGGYDAPLKPQVKECTDNDSSLMNGFATRVLQLTELPQQRNRDKEAEMQGDIKGSIVKEFLEDLVKLGANPFRQVVSGAGLCLSDGAILDLPPFSNMHLNVMWIDDHLKYALHDELGHFGRWTRTHHRYEARVSAARFSQLRHTLIPGNRLFTYNDVRWHIRTYMLRLILGCVADSWLRGNFEVKESTSSLPIIDYNRLARSIPHIYGRKFMEVVPGGWESYSVVPKDQQVKEFKQNLWRQGRERLQSLVQVWRNGIYEHTFLGLFVYGTDHPRYQEFIDFFPVGMIKGLTIAVRELPELYQNAQPSSPDAIPNDDPTLEQALVTLVDDFVDYMSLVQFWPFFVQSVRAFQNQHVQYSRPNLEWMFPIL